MHFLREWGRDGLACLATHDMPTVAGWWSATDIALRRDLGLIGASEYDGLVHARGFERRALCERFGATSAEQLSPLLHAAVAAADCRLMAVQIEDTLGVVEQINVPGTVDEHPNWRRRLPVLLEHLAEHPGWQAHTAAMRQARPR
jgi:4-alpha-glucanotransferase